MFWGKLNFTMWVYICKSVCTTLYQHYGVWFLQRIDYKLQNGYRFHATLSFTDNEAEPLGGSPALFCKAENLMLQHCPPVSSGCVSVKNKLSPHKAPLCIIRPIQCDLILMKCSLQIRSATLSCLSPEKSLSGQPFGHWCYRKYISKRTLKSSNLDCIVNLKVGCEEIKSHSESQGQ